MFLSKKVHLTNNVRHRRELIWHPFLTTKLKHPHKKPNYFRFTEYKLPAHCVRGFFKKKESNKIHLLLTDHSDTTILTPIKYGLEVGHLQETHYYNLLISKKLEYRNINRACLLACNSGTFVYSITNCLTNMKIAVSSGVFAIIYRHDIHTHLTKIKLPSGLYKYIPSTSDAYIGRNGNIYYKYVVWGSWGLKYRNKHHRPIVRGVAMNPIDHPNGGRSKVKKPFRNKYNKIAKKGK
jgi:ribosomal protein L2